MKNIVVWAQEVVFIHVLLRYLDIDVGWDRFCIWVKLPVQTGLCPIFVRNVGSPGIHECSVLCHNSVFYTCMQILDFAVFLEQEFESGLSVFCEKNYNISGHCSSLMMI